MEIYHCWTSYTNLYRPHNGDAKSVQVTGNFDNWGKTFPPLVKDDNSNCFKGTIKLNTKQDLEFKFIINGDIWSINEEYLVKSDEFGNHNNFVPEDELRLFEEFEQGQISPELEPVEEQAQENPAHEQLDDIQQVLTSSSSFAAVSLPSNASNFEHIEPESMPNHPVSNQISQSESMARPNLSDSVSTLNNPNRSGALNNEVGDLNSKIPGAYPSTPKSESPAASINPSTNPSTNPSLSSPGHSSRKPPGKKDGLVSRFKGFFK